MNRGHLRKRGDSWQLQVFVGKTNGKRGRYVTRTVNGTQKEASEALSRFVVEADQGGLPSGNSTVEEYLNQWLGSYAATNVQPSTYKRYEQLIRIHVLPSIGKSRLNKLDPFQLQDLYGRVQQSNCRRTALKVHNLLHLALKHAKRWRLVRENVTELVDAPRAEQTSSFVPAPGDVQRVLAAANGMATETLVYMAVMTGLRQGELLGLRWSDVDFENGRLHVCQSAQYVPGKGTVFKTPKTKRSARAVPMTAETISRLRQHHAKQLELRLKNGRDWANLDLVFTDECGKPPTQSSVRWQWEIIRKRAGVPQMRFHDLRHAHATLLLLMGVHPKIVSERLGHAGIGVTMDIYSHVMAGVQEEAIKGLDRLVGG